VDCHRTREGEAADRAAKHLFAYSVLYLFVLFAVMLVEQGFGLENGAVPVSWTL
jgi:protoheme IX farnesyltransferase